MIGNIVESRTKSKKQLFHSNINKPNKDIGPKTIEHEINDDLIARQLIPKLQVSCEILNTITEMLSTS